MKTLKPTNLRKIDTEVESLLNIGRKESLTCEKADAYNIESLKYVYDMLLELRSIAKATKEESLVYYIEMSAMEASDVFDALKMKLDGKERNT